MNVLDLFAGAGGLSEGFKQAGFNIAAHVEIDSNACDTLRTREAFHYLKSANKLSLYEDYLLKKINRSELYSQVPKSVLDKVIEEEISAESIPTIFKRIDAILGTDSIDIVIGGPPCQAYSTAGISRCPNRMQNDPRNYMYLFYKQFLVEYQPRMFLFENVKGILTAKKGEVFKDLLNVIDEAGYNLEYKLLNAKEFGVPQNRERVIIIGWKKEYNFSYPDFSSSSLLTVEEALQNLPKVKAGESLTPTKIKKMGDSSHPSLQWIMKDNVFLTQHIARPNNSIDLEIYRLVVNAWNNKEEILMYNDIPKNLQKHKNTKSFLDRYKSLKPKQASHTVVAHIAKDGHYYIHYDIQQNRSITVREAARIQSFPDNFYFERSRTAAFTQIGNAVPPLMAYKIAKELTPLLK
ncbi:Modification methylase HaeIII [Metalysinibacillus saudimassiliensis]|uniref:Cytosine-specific methyltransferase n=1 Tax=Metalysinibacillus saudimassiliensis TaxID=1461583 RepID=A0A078M5D9_9BACL|nr:Modification methylase HaeIII [Metalysinibacillus saudimassiliensis]